MKLGEIMWSWR